MDDELTQLYNDKLSIAEKPEPVIKKKPKKKKDIEVLDLYTKELQYYEYDILNGVKIYNGVLYTNKKQILANTELFKRMSPVNVFTELIGCTLTCTGEFSNINFTESILIPTLDIPPMKYIDIIQIGCNYGEIFVFPHPLVEHDIAHMIKCIEVTTVKIGCSCQPPMNIADIRTAVGVVNNSASDFAELFNTQIRNVIKTESKFPKKRISKIIKNFVLIQNYQSNNLSADEMREVYNVIDVYIQKNDNIKFFNTHINNIKTVVEIFDKYKRACKCDAKYLEDRCANADTGPFMGNHKTGGAYTIDDVVKKNLTKNVKSSTRGRKPKIKEKKKRKIQGSGKYFSSQITFYIYNHHNGKITKLKVFRNGRFQIPGGLMPDMSDLIDSIKTLQLYFDHILFADAKLKTLEENVLLKTLEENVLLKTLEEIVPLTTQTTSQTTTIKVGIVYVISVMRNYTSRITNTDDDSRTIMLQKLEDIFCDEKAMQTNANKSHYVALFNELQLPQYIEHKIYNYCNTGFYAISEISFNSERYPGLLVKFLRPIPENPTKKITVKILSSGKINFDGCTSELEVTEIYYWLQYIFNKYWSEIIHDSTEKLNEIISSDTDSDYESIYDS
jgi:hypothetical protein